MEPGNFAFDYVLLALEVGGFALAVWSLIAIGLNPRGMAGRALD